MMTVEIKIDKLSDKLDAMARDVSETNKLNAVIATSLTFYKDTLDAHGKKHEETAEKINTLEHTFTDKIHQQVKSAKYMGYLGTMVGGTLTFLGMHLKKLWELFPSLTP